jgi:hypothetical protein
LHIDPFAHPSGLSARPKQRGLGREGKVIKRERRASQLEFDRAEPVRRQLATAYSELEAQPNRAQWPAQFVAGASNRFAAGGE